MFSFNSILAEQQLSDVPEQNELNIRLNPSVILIEDSTLNEIPVHLEKILKNVITQTKPSQSDLLFSVLYGIALEVGFICDEKNLTSTNVVIHHNWSFTFNNELTEKYSQLPTNWCQFDGLINTIQLTMPNINKESYNMMSLKSGDFIIVTLVPPQNSQRPKNSVCLSISRYVPLQNYKEISRCFRNLKELTIKVKNELFLPLRNDIYLTAQCLNPSLLGVPQEVLYCILRYLNQSNKAHLARTCKTIYYRIVGDRD